MEKLKYTPKESFDPSIEELDREIRDILDPKITKEGFKEFWKDPRFAKSFPNMVYLLTSPQGSDKFTHEQKQRIFELGLKSLMELPWTGGTDGAAIVGKMLSVNEETQLWEGAYIQKIKPGTEPLARLEIGSLILLGFSLKDKQSSKKLIIGCYKNLKDINKTASKPRSFRDHIMGKLIIANNSFRRWVKRNNLDTNNGFEWDREVPKLGLMLLPQDAATPAEVLPNNLPPEFKDLKNFPPLVIDEFANHALRIPMTNRVRSDLVLFIGELDTKLQSDSFKDDPAFNNDPHLYSAIQNKRDLLA